ncbi:origin recognition complex subunit 2, putative [Plasmodium malariae]|uniref:Origin recognition complex subunit 2, putative n=1 Tax=Plasmodium malariae TaxID=5858 RepID=A0A1D3JK59_PLAMA|nr:origin recognition complex subunit 2, putative [Plasmodium malariae]SBT86879.1 origin recognition complex subunit 2, putative [Plasmodium malariae]
MKNIEVNSPKKKVKMVVGAKDEENEKEEYLITNLTENNKNMPSLIVRIPNNVNKFLSKEEVKIDFNENIKLTNNNEKSKKLSSFKMEKSPTNTYENTYASVDIKLDATYQSDSNNSNIYSKKKLKGQGEHQKENALDANYDEEEDDDEEDEDEMNENLIKTFRNNYVEKYETSISNESVAFLREHTKNELEHFLQRGGKYHYSDEMKINDIINIDYDKLNEKNIIPYFLTSMFDIEQKKKREKMKQQLEAKRKLTLEKQKKMMSNKVENEKKKKKKKMHKGTALSSLKLDNKKSKSLSRNNIERGSILKRDKLKEDAESGEGEDGAEVASSDEKGDVECSDECDEAWDKEHQKSNKRKNEQGSKLVKEKRKNKKMHESENDNYDLYIDELGKEEMDINIYNDPTLYGIEGSSDYSEGLKSELDNSQEEEAGKDQGVTNNFKTKKKKKNVDEEQFGNDEKIEDIVDSATQKLISYDYYSSLNIKEIVKPNYKIKSLSSFIPIEENLDKLDHVQKLQYLIKNLPHTHIKEKRSLYHYNVKQFIKWKVYLLNNINICLYGIGSKFHLLNLFTNICLNDGNKCIILGFEEEVNFEEILMRILEYHYNHKSSKNLKSFDLLYELVQKVNESNIPLYFIIHNLDNMKLYPYYEYFSFLSQYDNIYFICSIDDVSFELNMNFKNISTINFHYMKCHTWLDYRHEILRQWNKFLPEWVFNKKCEEIDVKNNIETILNALSINHKRLFKIIASIQLENLEKGIYGVEKESLLQDKRLFTVGTSSIRINSLLVEFVSHNVITETRLKEGNTFLKINADKGELKRIVEQL